MLNLMDRDITYTHRTSDFTQDVSVGGIWVASATCNHIGEEVADEIQYRTLQADPPIDIPQEPYPPTPGGPEPPEFAQTLQSQAIEQAAQRNRICADPDCQGPHYTFQCPHIHAALFAPAAPWSDPGLGRELCRMRWRDFRGFVALLTEVHARGHLAIYAASYQAFVASLRPDTDLTVEMVSATWQRIISGEPMPRMRAA